MGPDLLDGPLLNAGLLLGVVLLAQLVAVRHLPAEIPAVMMSRVELSNRVRPWLIALAAVLTMTGLLLRQ